MTINGISNKGVNFSRNSERDSSWDKAVQDARKAGIQWELPSNDNRSAKSIIEDNPLLKNLGNQSGVKDMLKERVGNFERNADAAYRAIQVLEHVEKYDEKGNRIVSDNIGNSRIDGFTNSGEARHGTEAGRLQDFGKEGFSSLEGKLASPDTASDNNKAQNDAEKLGIKWQRPAGDNRSAKNIINDNPLLKNLGNQSGVKDMLKERVGNFERNADAAYRAIQVLEHVEKYDEKGNRIVSDNIGNSRIDGFTNSGEARHGTEAGRLQDFGKEGFSALKGKLASPDTASDNNKAQNDAEKLGIKWQRPAGDNRSAKNIINDNPLLKNLGNQSGIKDMLKERVGDFERDADAAYRAIQVLEHVEKYDEKGNRIAGVNIGNSRIDGFTKSGEARHGTEAGRLQDFGKEGFSALKGELISPDTVGDNKKAREYAEKVDIKWELPEDDNRSAQEIIDDSPLLKNLGNQSGVKDMLKERVGDFEKDPDAAYRASQVLDRITMYDGEGNSRSGDGVANSRIDGFTSSGQAKPNTEAGRLQDFGKYGFKVIKGIKNTEEIDSYKAFIETNPDADAISKKIAKYAAIIDENYDAIRGKTESGDYLTAEALEYYKNTNPQISEDFKEALDFWAQPGAFDILETAKSPLRQIPDGDMSKSDLKSWLEEHTPKNAESAVNFLSRIVNANIAAGVDTEKLDKDLFDNPENYSAEDKAAALQDLIIAQALITEGANAGMWGDDYSIVSISNKVRSHPDPKMLLQDVNDHIAILQNDPEVADYLEENTSKQMSKLLGNNKGLAEAVETTYYEEIISGEGFDSLWKIKMEDGDTSQQAVLAEFFSSAQLFQSILGIEDISEIQNAIKNSKYNDELERFYETSLASGDRFDDLLKDNSLEAAASAFSAEVALYTAALDPDFTNDFDNILNENFSDIVQKNAFKDASFDDIKKAFGVDGGDQLDEEKIKAIIEKVRNENPELLINPDGSVATTDQIINSFRGEWDLLRQGTKLLSELDLLNPGSGMKAASDAGVMHGVSGLFLAGITIAKGASSGSDNLTDRQIVDITTGSIMSAAIMTEGGVKRFQQYLKNTGIELEDDIIKKLSSAFKKFENSAKGFGGITSVVAGAYGIFDGVESIRKGETLKGGFDITASSLGLMAGLASAVEGGLGVFAPSLLRSIPIGAISGSLGVLAATAAILVFIPMLVEEGKQQARADDFGKLLSHYLTKYEIDGVKDGDISDIPDEAWPRTTDGMS